MWVTLSIRSTMTKKGASAQASAPCICPEFFRFPARAGWVKIQAGQPEDRAMQGCNPIAALEAGAGEGAAMCFAAFWRTVKIGEGLVMTLTLNLPPQMERAYLAEAQLRGVSLDEVVLEALARVQPSVASTELSDEEWDKRFERWTSRHAGSDLPLLSDESISRESIYGERGL
jgi:hypothetical protein